MQKVMNGRSFCVHCPEPIKASGAVYNRGEGKHLKWTLWPRNYNIHDDGTALSRGRGGVE